LAEHLAKRARWKEPLEEFLSPFAEGMSQTLVKPRREAIERYAESGNFDLRHSISAPFSRLCVERHGGANERLERFLVYLIAFGGVVSSSDVGATGCTENVFH
jgi:hypothetical protein